MTFYWFYENNFIIRVIAFTYISMKKKEKIAITIHPDVLDQIDKKIDGIGYKNRSQVIENILREWLQLKQDIWALVLAHENKWDDNLYPFDYPKALIKIESKTLLEKHIENVIASGVSNIVISYSHPKVEDFLKTKRYKANITFVKCDEETGSLEAIMEAQKILETKKILVCLCDNYFYNLELLDFIHYHNTWNQNISLIVTTIPSGKWYGNIKLQGSDIIKFVEKPDNIEDMSYIINAWLYLINTHVLPEKIHNPKIESEFFWEYAKQHKMKAYFHDGAWFHVQSNNILQQLNINN